MDILNKFEMKDKTDLVIEQNFNMKIKQEIYDYMIKAKEQGFYGIELGKDYKKYYKLIKKLFKKEKYYKVKKLYEEGIGIFGDGEWEGIWINWK